MTLVSILIPCYNAERWIAQAIESALAQTWTPTETIVVDDGSTDGSLGIIKGFGDRIRWESGAHQGGNVARNRLLALARGTWLQYLDADDYLMPDKIAGQMAVVEANGEAEIVYGPVTVERWRPDGVTTERLDIPEPRDPWILLARWQLPQTGAPLFLKRAIEEVGGWKPDQPVAQEHELYLRLLQAGKRFVYAPANGAVYREWSQQTLWTSRKPEQRRRRLAIEEDAARSLEASGALTPGRAEAIAQAVFGMARVAWREGDHDGARLILDGLQRLAPAFTPRAEPAAYRWLWRLIGFERTERILSWRRSARDRR